MAPRRAYIANHASSTSTQISAQFYHSDISQGFVQPSSTRNLSSSSPHHPLPYLPLSTCRPSPTEVSALLPLPLSALLDPSRQSLHYFRMDSRRPYWRVRAGDLVISCPSPSTPTSNRRTTPSTRSPECAENAEVWGLSGWFLNCLARRVGWLREIEAYVADD